MIEDDGLEILTEDQCRQLLAGADVGRIGVVIGGVPVILPVNYCIVGDAIVFRTGPGTKLRAALDAGVVAFEVDDHHPADRSGWSVLAVGSAQVANAADVDADTANAARRLVPFADGERDSIVRIPLDFVSGRRLLHRPP